MSIFKKDKTVQQTKNWYQDRYETVVIQRNIMFFLVITAIVIFAFTIVGVIKLNSTKVYEPFIVQIEENTGIITKVNNSAIREITAEKAIRNSSIVRYILSREGYNYADFSFNYYQVVRLMSDKNVYNEFNALINSGNIESPLRYGFDHKIEVRIKSLIELNDKENLIQVRIAKAKMPTRSIKSSEQEFEESHKNYIITLRYDYRELELSETERYINPLGIQIIAYRIDEEQNAKKI